DDNIKFNENLKGFHNYDLNISFEYKKFGYKLIVTNEILVEHFSLGTLNASWIDSTFKIHSLYQTLLPLKCLESETNKKTEIRNAQTFINECLKYKKNKVASIIWIQLFNIDPFSKLHIRFGKRL